MQTRPLHRRWELEHCTYPAVLEANATAMAR